MLSGPPTGRQTTCNFCQPTIPVYMSFFQSKGWQVSFLHKDMRTTAAPPRTFSSPQKILDLARRGGGLPDLAAKQSLTSAIENGRGGLDLNLTPEQFEKLRQSPQGQSRRRRTT
jgi:hypothetical protein